MGLSAGLGNLYVKLEDAYYGVLDFFEEKGIGFPWAYNDALESKGIPALPVTLALFVLLIGGLAYLVTTPTTQDISFTLQLRDHTGESLRNASLQIVDEQGNIIKELTASDGQTILLEGISPQAVLTVQARKQGYESNEATLLSTNTGLRIILQGDNEAIVGKLKIVDKETQTPIPGVVVSATWTGNEFPLTTTTNAEGVALLNAPLNKAISLTLKANNYEDLVDIITFTGTDTKIKELSPKADARSGTSTVLVKAIDAQTKILLGDVRIVIEDAASGATYTDILSSSGQHSETIPKGTVIRVRVEKEGYLGFSTNTANGNGLTLRNQEETIIASLGSGGISLVVTTRNQGNNNPLTNVQLLLLDANNQKLADLSSSFSGDAEFPGLNQTRAYWVLAFHPNYFPLRTPVLWDDLPASEGKKTLALFLNAITTEQSGTLVVFVSHANGKAANDAVFTVWEKEGGGWLPYVYEQRADAGGSFTLRVPIGKTLLVEAAKGDVVDNEEVTIAAGLNKITLSLTNGLNEIRFNLRLPTGAPFQGEATFTSQAGEVLFTGEVGDGFVNVDVLGNRVVNLRTRDAQGNTFSQTLTLDGSENIDVVIGETTSVGDAPSITFLGLVDAGGNTIPGLAPDHEGFARFEVRFPPGKKGVFHVRAGSDTITSIDSQFIGITGLNGDATKIEYGKTYSPNPPPGNEPKDRAQRGKAGSFNKWIEVTLDNPAGTHIFDVRLAARAGIPTGTQELQYRASLEGEGGVQRTPTDDGLGSAPFTPAKSGLYADTRTIPIPIYPRLPFCTGDVCATLFFVDENNREYEIGGFRGVTGKTYALHVEMLPPPTSTGAAASSPTTPGLVPLATTASATIRMSTSATDPLLFFTKGEVPPFGKLDSDGVRETNISIPLPTFSVSSPGKARAHFVTQGEGETSIQVNLVTSQTAWSREIPITLTNPRVLQVQLDREIPLEEGIRITVQDEQGNPITNAFISLQDAKGKMAISTKGRNLPQNGENGGYLLANRLAPGIYAVKIDVPGFERFEESVAIGISNPLQLEEKVAIAIPFGQTKVTQNISVRNNTPHPITNITGTFVPFEGFPTSLQMEFVPPASIPPNGSAIIQVSATYTGTDTQSSHHGTTALRVQGEVLNGHVLGGNTQLSITYNPALDPACLAFNKQKLSVLLMGESQPFGSLYGGAGGFQTNPAISPYGLYGAPNTEVYNAAGTNAYGYEASGYYSNPELKRVSVEVTNNCGQELNVVPSILAPDGSLQVDGLRIAAVDSGLVLKNGQKKAVDISITNELLRQANTGFGGYGYGDGFSGMNPAFGMSGYAGRASPYQVGMGYPKSPLTYTLAFRAPQVAASLPLEINFWDRQAAVQAPASVELTLIQKDNQPASDRAIIPLTNIGSVPIFGVQAQIEGETIPGLALKLEGAIQIAPRGTGVTLAPGQTMQPPLNLVGELTRVPEKNPPRTIVISGIVEGKRILLRRVDISIQTGTSSCLEISALDTPILFASSTLSGTISKPFTIRNTCLEPVRITRITPSTVGTNGLDINPLQSGDEIIEKDAEATYHLFLTKQTPTRQTVSIQVEGIQVLSQRGVASNPLLIDIRIGENELEQGLSTNAIPVPLCGGGTIDVRFPVVAQKDECTQAYCDAEQAANFLSKTIEQQISKTVQLMQGKKNDASQFTGCDLTQRYCTFPQLGIQNLTFDLYLQHDIVSPEIMNYAMQGEKYPRLKGMQAQLNPGLQGENPEEVFRSRLGTGLGGLVFIPPLQGCGQYTLTLMGGVEVAANQLQPNHINVGVAHVTYRKTAECQDTITNAANFLPRDGTLTFNNNRNTLLGMVTSSDELRTQGEWLADTVFGSPNRYALRTGSNHLDLRIGNLTESVVELTLDPTTTGNDPKRILTTVKRTQGNVPKEVISEVGQILTSLGSNVNGCVTPDLQTWRIFSIKDVGAFTYEGCSPGASNVNGLAVRSSLACCTLESRSDIKSNVSYTLNPNGTTIPGLTELNLYETGGAEEALSERPTNIITYGAEYELGFDPNGQVYRKEVLLCGQTDPRIQQRADRVKVESIATRTLDGVRADPLSIELRTCTQTPEQLLSKALQKGDGTWHGTVDWTEDQSQKTIQQVTQQLSATRGLGESYVSYAGQGIKAIDNPVYEAALRQRQDASLLSFGATCAITCGACQLGAGLIFGGTTLAAGAIDCAVSCGAGGAAGWFSVHQEQADGTFLETPADIAGYPVNALREGTDFAFDIDEENEPAAAGAAFGTLTSVPKNLWKPVRKVSVGDPTNLIKETDLAFIEQTQRQIITRIEGNKLVAAGYMERFKDLTIPPTPAGGVRQPARIATIPVVEADQWAKQIRNFASIQNNAAQKFDNLITAYEGKPGFNKAEMDALKGQVLDRITQIDKETTSLRKALRTGYASPYPDEVFKHHASDVSRLASESLEKAKSFKIPSKYFQTKAGKITKAVGQGLVCGGAGNVAGYFAYRSMLTKEIENKITLQTGSNNVLDAVTQELVFEKGQSYAITVGQDSENETGRIMTIDLLPNDAYVAPATWVDCG